MEITRQEALQYFMQLQQVGHLADPQNKFVYARRKNMKKLETNFKKWQNLQQIENPSKEYIESAKDKVNLINDHVRLDPQGRPVTTQNGFAFKSEDSEKEFTKSMEKLDKKYPKVIKEMEDHEKKKEDFLKEKVTYIFHIISEEDVPPGINGDELEAIEFMTESND